MYKLIYDENKQIILQIDSSGRETTVSDEFSSQPKYSPNKNHAVFISPIEWESESSLYLYNLKTGKITELLSMNEDQNIPKDALWLDNTTIVLIIGYSHGTISVGGDVYTLNIENRKLKKVSNYLERIQITKLTIESDYLELEGIEYTDDNYEKFIEFRRNIPLNTINK